MTSGRVPPAPATPARPRFRALLLDPVGDRLDPAVRLDDALVAVVGVAQEHVAFDQCLGEFARERVDQPHLSRHVGRRVDDAVLAAESGKRQAVRRQARLGLREILRCVADGVFTGLFGKPVHQRARFRHNHLGDSLRILGGEGVRAHVDDPGARFVAQVDHTLPVGKQVLDRGVLAQGEDRIPLGPVVEVTEVKIGIDAFYHFLAENELEEDIGIRS